MGSQTKHYAMLNNVSGVRCRWVIKSGDRDQTRPTARSCDEDVGRVEGAPQAVFPVRKRASSHLRYLRNVHIGLFPEKAASGLFLRAVYEAHKTLP